MHISTLTLVLWFSSFFQTASGPFCIISSLAREGFLKSVRAWMDFLSKGVKTLIDLKRCSFSTISHVVINNQYGSFSLRETMLKLGQPYIEWSDGILSTGYLPIDRQHQWLLTIVNISFLLFGLRFNDMCWFMWTRGIRWRLTSVMCLTRSTIMPGSISQKKKNCSWTMNILASFLLYPSHHEVSPVCYPQEAALCSLCNETWWVGFLGQAGPIAPRIEHETGFCCW